MTSSIRMIVVQAELEEGAMREAIGTLREALAGALPARQFTTEPALPAAVNGHAALPAPAEETPAPKNKPRRKYRSAAERPATRKVRARARVKEDESGTEAARPAAATAATPATRAERLAALEPRLEKLIRDAGPQSAGEAARLLKSHHLTVYAVVEASNKFEFDADSRICLAE